MIFFALWQVCGEQGLVDCHTIPASTGHFPFNDWFSTDRPQLHNPHVFCVSIGYTRSMTIKDLGLRIRVERELREGFLDACRAAHVPAAQVLRSFMREFVDKFGKERLPRVPVPQPAFCQEGSLDVRQDRQDFERGLRPSNGVCASISSISGSLGRASDGSLELAGDGKDVIRGLHSTQRSDKIAANQAFIQETYDDLSEHFASGCDVASGAHHPGPAADICRYVGKRSVQARLPHMGGLPSNGFGRRLRYLVWDAHNDKLIGLLIGDPVFNLAVRDKLIGWNAADRGERLVNILDAYVLGAVPPYNTLLGGKLVASLIRTRDLYNDFNRTYGATAGIISGKEKKARLLAVTTSSSLGRSSIYNRLKLGQTQYFQPYRLHRRLGSFSYSRQPLLGPACLFARDRSPICRPSPLRTGSQLASPDNSRGARRSRTERAHPPTRYPA